MAACLYDSPPRHIGRTLLERLSDGRAAPTDLPSASAILPYMVTSPDGIRLT